VMTVSGLARTGMYGRMYTYGHTQGGI